MSNEICKHNCGAILYFWNENFKKYYYLIIKDIKGNFLFPMGYVYENEKSNEGAIRLVKEKVGLDVVLDDVYEYHSGYSDSKSESIDLYLSFIDKDGLINDPYIESIMYLDYASAYEKLSLKEAKDALFEAHLYLLNGKNICCMFKEENADNAYSKAKANLEIVESYGDDFKTYTCNDAGRVMCRCKECGNYVIHQMHDISMMDDDHYYDDYIPVLSYLHGRFLNSRHSYDSLESGKYPYKKLFVNDGRPVWH